MKLILTSSGFNAEIIKKTEQLVGKPKDKIDVAIINEAYAVEHDNNLRWVLNDLNPVVKNFGGNLELVNLLALDKKTVEGRLLKCDVIFVVGGNTDYLMSLFDKTGFSKTLKKLLVEKVYVGSSAGSMVLGQRLSTDSYKKIYGEEGSFGVKKYLELVNMAIMPHLDSPSFANRKETLKGIKKEHQAIYGLTDGSAVIVEDNEISIIGDEPFIK